MASAGSNPSAGANAGAREPPVLPPLYARWLGARRLAALPRERRAACARCVMLADTPQPACERPRRPFDPRTKCCTYQPVLPNFTLGLALLDPERCGVPAREALRRRIRAGVGLSPLSLGRAPVFVRRYDAPGAAAHFGRDVALRCPFYVDARAGACGIWAYRPAVCATWFCRHEQRARGRAVWAALQGVLAETETALAIWVAERLGRGEALRRHLLPDPLTGRIPEPLAWRADGTLSPAERARLWGRWQAVPERWFIACAEHVLALDRAAIEQIAGERLARALERLDAALAACVAPIDPARRYRHRRPRHTEPLVSTCTRGGGGVREGVSAPAPERVRVTTYSRHDPIVLPAAWLEALGWLDARRPLHEWLHTVRARLGAPRARALAAALGALADAGLLEPCSER